MGISRYERPGSLGEACDLLLQDAGNVVVLSGGTDLVADMRAGRKVDMVVDIKRIPGLADITWLPDGTLEIGSCVTMRRVSEEPRIRERYRALFEAAGQVASHQVRCRATIAGNLGNASPCADNAPPLLVFGAKLRIACKGGSTDVPLLGFMRDCKKTALQRGEIITTVIVPPAPPGLRSAFLKVKRVYGHDMALINAAASYDPATREIRLAIGSAAPTPLLIGGLEGICPPGATAGEVGARMAEKALEVIKPIDDVRASAEYRRDMARVLCARLARALLEQ
jgi:aerobic carbon-monoxide dehydrogenase medium subunit